MKKIKHFFKRLCQRQYFKILKRIKYSKYNKYLERNEREILFICRNLLKDPKTLIFYSNKNTKRYVVDWRKNLFFILEGYKVKIVNHVYSYDLVVSESTMVKIEKLIDNDNENRISNIEFNINENIKHSLVHMCNKLKKNK
jgi:hypothetical protein